MSKLAVCCLGFFWSAFCWAQQIPTVRQWTDIFHEIQRHDLFSGLDIRFAKAPAENVGYSPVGVLLDRSSGCLVVIAEGDNPRMRAIMKFGATPQQKHVLLVVAAAHELGHCLRVQQKQMSAQFWALVASTAEGSAQRHFMQRQASLEEAYADAYALVYIQDSHPELFNQALLIMGAMRTAPNFATPYYQVRPLYELLEREGFDTSLSLLQQVEVAVRRSNFNLD